MWRFVFVLFLSGCGIMYVYNSQKQREHIQNRAYEKALHTVEKNTLLNQKRNVILHHLEMGKLHHLKGDYTKSNYHFNTADELCVYKGIWGDFFMRVAGIEQLSTYAPYPFHRVFIHYYKALNYYYLHQIEDVLVEAKRLDMLQSAFLSNNKTTASLFDQRIKTQKPYKKWVVDPFGYVLIGHLYELISDYNNAFIAYKNACNVYAQTNYYTGINTPNQLKKDVLKMAYLTKNKRDFDYYRKLYPNATFDKTNSPSLILYWEQGSGPQKVEDNYIFLLNKRTENNTFFFLGPNGEIIPTDITLTDEEYKTMRKHNLHIFRFAFPHYENQRILDKGLKLYQNGKLYPINNSSNALINVEHQAHHRLQRDFIMEASSQLITQIISHSVQAKTLENDSMSVLPGLLKTASFLAASVDVRDWQSLPKKIRYIRVPLKNENNKFCLMSSNNHLCWEFKINKRRVHLKNVISY